MTIVPERECALLQYLHLHLRRLRRHNTLQVIAFTLIALLSGTPDADELRPALVNLKQDGRQSWQLEFRQPQIAGRFLNLRLATNCSLSEPVNSLSASYLTQHFQLLCTKAPLTELSIEGLEGSLIDVLVSLTDLEEKTTNHLLSSTTPKLVLALRTPLVTPIYLQLGITHLLFGLDHLLFVLLLPFLIRGLKPLFWVVTSFTLAHSITLSLVALNLISLPEAPTEALIALSIALVAREALGGESLIHDKPWLASFLFGLLHGAGFAGALSRIGLPQEDAITALFLFNLGIEIGQLGILLPALVLLAVCSRWQWNLTPLRPYPIYAIGGISMMWFIQRIV